MSSDVDGRGQASSTPKSPATGSEARRAARERLDTPELGRRAWTICFGPHRAQGIFVGPWAPTFTGLGNALKLDGE